MAQTDNFLRYLCPKDKAVAQALLSLGGCFKTTIDHENLLLIDRFHGYGVYITPGGNNCLIELRNAFIELALPSDKIEQSDLWLDIKEGIFKAILRHNESQPKIKQLSIPLVD